MNTQRITIWGNSGSGKSTLAESIGKELGLPVYHIDHIAWQTGWRYTDEATFLSLHQQWIIQPSWIIEGVGHTSGLRERFIHSDLIVFLDTPADVCRTRAQRRIDDDREKPNQYIASGCRYGDVIEKQWQVIDYFERHLQADVVKMLERDFRSTRQLRLDGSKAEPHLLSELKQALSRLDPIS